jgi:anti-sigma regulatory factor (Ser/Thr protein kinase)
LTQRGLAHEALIYDTDQAWIQTVVPFLQEGLALGYGCVVATNETNEANLRDALGSDADQVLMVPASDLYRSPHSAIRGYHEVLSLMAAKGHTRTHAIGEVLYPEQLSGTDWLRYEPLAHAVFERSPLTVICPYDARTLPSDLIDHGAKTHPVLAAGPRRQVSHAFTEPAESLRALPSSLARIPNGPPSFDLQVADMTTADIRAGLRATLAGGLSPDRIEEAVLAVFELVTNGLRHGMGETHLRCWVSHGSAICAVSNDGPPIDDLLAGYRPPRDLAAGGMGLWLARQLSDHLAIGFDDRGPVVVASFVDAS